MSERIDLQDVLREYGIPLIKLDVTASQEQCLRLREHLMTLSQVSGRREQGYLQVECTFFIDVHDIDRYLHGELPNLAEIYAFDTDVKAHNEEE